MSTYKCPGCNYQTSRKHDMERHINKKNTCVPTNVIVDNLKVKYHCINCPFVSFYKSDYDIHERQCSAKVLIDLKIEQEKKKLEQETLKIEQEKQKLANLKMKNQSLVHGQKYIQNNQTNNQMNNQFNNNSNSNNVQFFLNAWTNPDLSHITDADYYDCLGSKEGSVLKFTKMVYFDPNVPQNHSIFLDDKRLLAYKDNNTWCPKERDDFVEDLIDNNDRYMDSWSIDNEDNDKFKDARKLYINTKKIINDNIDDIKSDLLDEFYANKTMVVKTQKLLKN